jgi:hypothetical protein
MRAMTPRRLPLGVKLEIEESHGLDLLRLGAGYGVAGAEREHCGR